MRKERLVDLLQAYVQKDIAPMHMPGHKRNMPDYLKKLSTLMDITELPDFDDLHAPQGILSRSMQRAAALYGASRSFYLVGGSTCGILSALYTLCPRDTPILAAANCHQSVYHAAELLRLPVCRLYPELDRRLGVYTSVSPAALRSALARHPRVGAVVLTDPTYEGVVSDLGALCAIARERNIPVLVDAAHGAHLGFDGYFPPSAVQAGADIVIQSLHKTLPSLTSTAIAHLSGTVDADRFAHALRIFETSSPSYLLLASIDGCIDWLDSADGRRAFSLWKDRLLRFRREAGGLRHFAVADADSLNACAGLDPGKLLIDCTRSGTDGVSLRQRLRERHGIETEMHTPAYVLAMTSPCDTEEHFNRLLSALKAEDAASVSSDADAVPVPPPVQNVKRPGFAVAEEKRCVPLAEAVGAVCGEYITPYPPGVPFLIPGDRLTEDAVSYLQACIARQIPIRRTFSTAEGEIAVLRSNDF